MLWHSLIIAHVYRISNKQTINVKKKFEVVFKEEALPHRKQIVSEGINCIKFQRVTWSYMHTESFELIIIYYTILALSIECYISNVRAMVYAIWFLEYEINCSAFLLKINAINANYIRTWNWIRKSTKRSSQPVNSFPRRRFKTFFQV